VKREKGKGRTGESQGKRSEKDDAALVDFGGDERKCEGPAESDCVRRDAARAKKASILLKGKGKGEREGTNERSWICTVVMPG
jgi:hypothetical protein